MITKNPGVKLRAKVTKNSRKTPVSSKTNKPEYIFKRKFPVPNPFNNKCWC